MPRKAKEKLEEENTKISEVKNSKSASTKEGKVKKATSTITTKSASSTTKKKSVASTSKAKKTTSTTKKTSSKKSTSRSKSTATKKSPKATPVPTSTLEYYDLPYRYNQTIVKILAQTPSVLFVYWDISDSDKEKLIKQYGDNFFQNTKPYLLITNESMNYQFEVEINDYANSWYLHIHDSDCKYRVELIRKSISQEMKIDNNTAYIASSNELETPNDHILFDHLGKTVFFKNTKKNTTVLKDISTLSLMNHIGRIYNVYDLYKEIYHDELNGDELGAKLSSSQFSSNFK